MISKGQRPLIIGASAIALFGLGYVTATFANTSSSDKVAAAESTVTPTPSSSPSSEPVSTPAPSPSPTSLITYTPAEYQETDQKTGEIVTKKGVLYQTNDTGATKWVDSEVLSRMGDRKDATRDLLDHSRKLIDAYLIGTSEIQGAGDYVFLPEPIDELLKKDQEQFETLYADELKRGSDDWLSRIVRKIDESYSGAIDNLLWGNKEKNDPGIDEEKEYQSILEKDADTRFMEARDVFQRYYTWLFGGKIGTIEGVKTEDLPVPDKFVQYIYKK